MKKYFVILLIFVILLTNSACGKGEQPADSGIENNRIDIEYDILIPTTWLKYSGLESKELCNSVLSLGEDYVTSAEVCEDGVKLTATQKQIDNLIQNCNENISSYISLFESSDDKYCFKGTSDYSVMEFYCDEHFNSQKLFATIAVVSTTYAFNNILYNKNPNWDVFIKVVNCHTGQVVIEGSILTDSMTINNEAWEKSYNYLRAEKPTTLIVG